MTQTRLALLLLAVGCSTEGSGTESATATSDPSGPHVVPPDEPQTPDLNNAAVAAGIEEALDVLFTFDLTPIEVGYAAIMAEAEDGCPRGPSATATNTGQQAAQPPGCPSTATVR